MRNCQKRKGASGRKDGNKRDARMIQEGVAGKVCLEDFEKK